MSKIILMFFFLIVGTILSLYAVIHAPAWAQLGMAASVCFIMVSVVNEYVE